MRQPLKLCGVWALSICVASLISIGHAAADTIIGNWESGTPEGWIDWGSGQAPIAGPRFSFLQPDANGASLGTGAIRFNLPFGGYTQWLAVRLQNDPPTPQPNGVSEWRDDFMAYNKMSVDFTFVPGDMTNAAGNDFATIGLNVNADGVPFGGIGGTGNPISASAFVSQNGANSNSFNPLTLIQNGTVQHSTWVYDIGQYHDGNPGNGELANQPFPNYIELIFDTYSNGGVRYHVDNIRFFDAVVPEPGSLVLMGLAVPALLCCIRRRRKSV